MKQVQKDKITNISSDKPNTFLFEYLNKPKWNIKVIDMGVELEKYKNNDLLDQLSNKPAMWGNVYSPEDELTIFTQIFESAISENNQVHVVWITLREELEILEKYYHDMWFFAEDINCYAPDFSQCLVTVSVNIENLMWRGSDYKAMWKAIFFNPPIRESWQVKALFKWINRWVVAGINFWELTDNKIEFLSECILNENILPIILAKVLKYNLEDMWMSWEVWSFKLDF